jgi:hypothetical protein
VNDLPPKRWLYRRILTYAICTALVAIAGAAVMRAPDPQWLGIAAIVALWLVSLQYVTAATAEDVTRITAAISEGLARSKE